MTHVHRFRAALLTLVICAAASAAPPSAAAAAHHEPQWMRALEIRSDALNRRYHLGRYAHLDAHAPATGFDWGAAIVGAGSMAAAVAGAGALALTIRSPRIRNRQARAAGRSTT